MSYTLISTQSINSSVSTVTFSNIPQTYTDLYLVISARTDLSGTNGVSSYVTINGSGTGFSNRRLYGNGTAAYSNSDSMPNYFGDINGTATTSNVFTTSSVYIPNYTSANYKSYEIQTIVENNNATAYDMLVSGLWSNVAAITSFSFTLQSSANFVQYSTASLYGVNRIPTATLGATPTVEYLVVAGGGGGGNAGAGAGGLLTGTGLSVASGTPLTVTVGAGGSKSSAGSNTGQTNGSGSSFNSISTTGGGSGQIQNSAVSSGGSGGGAVWNVGAGGTGITGQGYAGGAGGGAAYPNDSSGAGGGAGGAGGAGTSSGLAGNGGSGVSISITGQSLGYAGGGGANGRNSQGLAGFGGGGAGGANNGTPGALGTGGGGGGGASYGEAGGSGVVIIRYPDTYANPTATTGNPMVNYANGYKIYTWTASGSITF